jgi:hypothetical protein
MGVAIGILFFGMIVAICLVHVRQQRRPAIRSADHSLEFERSQPHWTQLDDPQLERLLRESAP